MLAHWVFAGTGLSAGETWLAASLEPAPGTETLKDTVVRAGQSSEKAALIYQHSDDERQQEVAARLDATVRKARQAAREAAAVPDTSEER